MVKIAVAAAGIIVASLFFAFMIRDVLRAGEDENLLRRWLLRYLVLLPVLTAAGFAAGYLGL